MLSATRRGERTGPEPIRQPFPHDLLKPNPVDVGEEEILWIANGLLIGVIFCLFLSMVSDPRPTQR